MRSGHQPSEAGERESQGALLFSGGKYKVCPPDLNKAKVKAIDKSIGKRNRRGMVAN
jgi:hypothetical protein